MYTVKLIPRAQRDLDKLEGRLFEHVAMAIESLRKNPKPPGCKKLTVQEGYRVRTGNYRIVYKIDDKTRVVFIYRVKHRKDIYR